VEAAMRGSSSRMAGGNAGTPLIAGRDQRNDDADTNSCILNQAAAHRYFPHTRAIGKMLRQVPWRFGNP
jgi:hypothetical protein